MLLALGCLAAIAAGVFFAQAPMATMAFLINLDWGGGNDSCRRWKRVCYAMSVRLSSETNDRPRYEDESRGAKWLKTTASFASWCVYDDEHTKRLGGDTAV
jgi:hypothetical protein